MSRAYKCDRCGKLYESYAAENKYDGLKATKITFRCNTKDGNYYDTDFFDLCQKCMKEILDIMNLDEEGEKKVKMTKEELVIGNRYKIRRPSIADGNVNSYQWSDATLVDISTHIAVFSVGEYCVTYKFCQLRDEVKEA